MENYFNQLNEINVNDKVEKKNGLTYLSWAWAWGEVKKKFPDTTYKIYENEDEFNYFTDGKTCWVKTGVVINGIEHIEYLPVMDFRNKSISAENVTSFDVNKAIQRSLTKACARHGLGLYIYAGEDLPESEEKTPNKPKAEIKNGKDFVLTSGKYPNSTLQQIYEKDKQYLTDLVASGKLGLALQNNIEKCFTDNGEIIEIKV